jgi:hypothetical protein
MKPKQQHRSESTQLQTDFSPFQAAEPYRETAIHRIFIKDSTVLLSCIRNSK